METLIAGESGQAGLIKDSTTATFMADVVDASMQVPVVVDFWAPWCGPCKQLGPLLEKIIREAKGAVRLVKVDIDKHPEIAQQMRVQSIPAVFAFKEGRPVDGFAGALPESQVREFVKRLTGGDAGDSPLAEALQTAETLLATRDFQGASGLYSQILQHDPENIAALAGMVKSLVGIGEIDRARTMVDGMSDEQKKDQEIKVAISQLDLATAAAAAGDLTELRRAVNGNPKDHEARLDLAMALYANNDPASAVDELLECIRIDRSWNDEAARKQLVKLFGALGHTDPLTIDARKRLSSILFS